MCGLPEEAGTGGMARRQKMKLGHLFFEVCLVLFKCDFNICSLVAAGLKKSCTNRVGAHLANIIGTK